MSNSIPRARQLLAFLALGLALVCGQAPAFAADAHSSPEDRARFVAITRSLEKAPLDPGLKADRAWALAWLTEAPDIEVPVCLDSIGGLDRKDYAYSGEVLFQYMFAMGAAVIEHPETSSDPDALQLAGVEAALNGYQVILREKPKAKSSTLDSLLQTRSSGQLPAYVKKAFARCAAGK